MPQIILDAVIGFTLVSISWAVGYWLFLLGEKSGLTRYLLIRDSPVYSFLYRLLLVRWFHRLLTRTPLRYTSGKMRLLHSAAAELIRVRREMVDSEVSHHCGFWILALASVLYLLNGGRGALFAVLSFYNIAGNLYPMLVQVRNRSRIDRILEHRETRASMTAGSG